MTYIPSEGVRALIKKLVIDPLFKESFLKDPKKAVNDSTLQVTEQELLLLSKASTDELDLAFQRIPEMVDMAIVAAAGIYVGTVYPRLSENKLNELKLISSMIAKGESISTINAYWKAFFKGAIDNLKPANVEEAKMLEDDLINYVLINIHETINADLLYSIQKVKFLNDMENQIQTEILKTRKIAEDYITLLEQKQEEIRNKRQEFTTAFENFDQKTNQLFNILSTVLKTLKETELGIVRNRNS